MAWEQTLIEPAVILDEYQVAIEKPGKHRRDRLEISGDLYKLHYRSGVADRAGRDLWNLGIPWYDYGSHEITIEVYIDGRPGKGGTQTVEDGTGGGPSSGTSTGGKYVKTGKLFFFEKWVPKKLVGPIPKGPKKSSK